MPRPAAVRRAVVAAAAVTAAVATAAVAATAATATAVRPRRRRRRRALAVDTGAADAVDHAARNIAAAIDRGALRGAAGGAKRLRRRRGCFLAGDHHPLAAAP